MKLFIALKLLEAIDFNDAETGKPNKVTLKDSTPGVAGVVPVFRSPAEAEETLGKGVKLVVWNLPHPGTIRK